MAADGRNEEHPRTRIFRHRHRSRLVRCEERPSQTGSADPFGRRRRPLGREQVEHAADALVPAAGTGELDGPGRRGRQRRTEEQRAQTLPEVVV